MDERSFNTWYQNTTGGDLEVHAAAQARSDNISVALVVSVNSTEALNIIRELRRFEVVYGNTVATTFVVPDGFYYQIDNLLNVNDYGLNTWVEQPMG